MNRKEVLSSQDDYLPSKRYKGRTINEQSPEAKLLNTATLKETKQAAGLQHWRSTNEFNELANHGPRTVVDGVEDLQGATTSLLLRYQPHLNEEPLKEGRRRPQEPASPSSGGVYSGEDEGLGESKSLTLSHALDTSGGRVDDRITPQTLNTLLKGSQKKVSKHLARQAQKKANYSYTTSREQKELNEKMLRSTAIAARTQEVMTVNQGLSNTYSEGTKGAVDKGGSLLPPATGRRTPTPPPAADGAIIDYYSKPVNQGSTEVIRNTILYTEPPSIAQAQQAKYFSSGKDDGGSLLHTPQPRFGHSSQPSTANTRVGHAPKRTGNTPPPARYSAKQLEAAEALITEEEATRMVNDDSAEPVVKNAKALGLDFAFTAATRGDDGALVQQLVQYYTASQPKSIPNPPLTAIALSALAESGAPPVSNDTNVSVLNAVLSVSREYERMRQSSINPSSGTMPNAARISEERQSIIKRLTAIDSTLIPEQFWVTIQDRAPQALSRSLEKTNPNAGRPGTGKSGPGATKSLDAMSARATAVCSGLDSGTAGAEGRVTSTVFPAAHPVGRAQVYLLAETLDTMLNLHPQQLKILADPDVATCILPQENPNATVGKYAPAEDPLLHPVLKKRSEEVYELYTNAANDVLQVLNAGFVEVVRQVASSCVERGALLDFLRQTLVDTTDSLIRVLAHTKKRTYREAETKLQLCSEMEQMKARISELENQVSELTEDAKEMAIKNKKLVLKAERFDALCERVAQKKRRFEVHEDNEHQAFLDELEKDMANAANGALDTLYKENVRLRTGEEPPEAKTEAPSEKQARDAKAEEKLAYEQLYKNSTQLIKSLREASLSMDAACAPLYDEMLLSKMSSKANVASTRWSEIARSIGAYEKELTRRQNIFNVFTKWCEAFQREDANQTQEAKRRQQLTRDNEFLEDSQRSDDEEVVDRLGEPKTAPGGERPSFSNLVSAPVQLQGQRNKLQQVQWEEMQQKRKGENEEQEKKTKQALAENNISTDLYEYGNTILRSIHYITPEDLAALGVTGCTAEEVNQLFERDFDFKQFLSPKYTPPEVELRLSDVVELLREVNIALQEISIRGQAMANSAVLKRGVEPPMQPPQYPEEACQLCGRRDNSEDEKRKRQEKMQQLAKEVQKKVDSLTEKCQKAEAERETTLHDLKRVEMELEQQRRMVDELRGQLSGTSPHSTPTIRGALVNRSALKKDSATTSPRARSGGRRSNRTSANTSPRNSSRRGSHSGSRAQSPSQKREGKGFNSPALVSPLSNKATSPSQTSPPKQRGSLTLSPPSESDMGDRSTSTSIMKKSSSFVRKKKGEKEASESTVNFSINPGEDDSLLVSSLDQSGCVPPRRRETVAKKNSIKPLNNALQLSSDDDD